MNKKQTLLFWAHKKPVIISIFLLLIGVAFILSPPLNENKKVLYIKQLNRPVKATEKGVLNDVEQPTACVAKKVVVTDGEQLTEIIDKYSEKRGSYTFVLQYADNSVLVSTECNVRIYNTYEIGDSVKIIPHPTENRPDAKMYIYYDKDLNK